MSTHINAFYGAVDEAKVKVKVNAAQAELDAAEAALQNHPDYVAPEKGSEPPKEEASEQAPPKTKSKRKK